MKFIWLVEIIISVYYLHWHNMIFVLLDLLIIMFQSTPTP